ncbi:MAG: AAA family ATPase [Steroidobacteraceae bacterium]
MNQAPPPASPDTSGSGPAWQLDELLEPRVWPPADSAPRLIETHISWVILSGPFAYKIKKPVDLGFFDGRSLEQRRALCETEWRLNRRLAPELYVDVVPIMRTAAGLRMGAPGDAVEYAVRMRRFDGADELSSLLERHAVSEEELRALAGLIADFHSRAPASNIGDAPHPQSFEAAIGRLVPQLQAALDRLGAGPSIAQANRSIAWLQDQARVLAGELAARAANGRVRECHGDLHSRNIVRWNGALLPFDCIEFSPALRWIDVMEDIAFLYMDLVAHARTDLAAVFLAAYLESGGDYAGLRVLRAFAVYRALVRAMVDGIAAEQQPQNRAALELRLRNRLDAADRLMARGEVRLILMHGVSGSGKSWLSQRLVPALPAVRVRSDLERKRLAGLNATFRGDDASLYQEDMNRKTQARLLECAGHALAGGFDVIVDATFLRAQDREPFARLARDQGARYVILSCRASPQVLLDRIRRRQGAGTDPSDADERVLRQQLGRDWSLGPAEQAWAISIDTGEPYGVSDIVSRLTCGAPALRE